MRAYYYASSIQLHVSGIPESANMTNEYEVGFELYQMYMSTGNQLVLADIIIHHVLSHIDRYPTLD